MKPRCAKRRVGDEALEVALDRGDDRPVDDPDGPEAEQEGRQGHDRPREQGEVEADDAVGAQLGHDAGEEDRTGGGRLAVGVGRPGVEREDRRLHGEGGREGQEQQHPGRARQVRVGEGPHVEGRHARLRGVDRDEGEDPDEQEGGGAEGVEEELPGRVPAPLVAPAGDQEIDRNERELEEDEEQEQVEGEEAAQAARLEHEDPHDEGLVAGAVAGGRERDREQQGRHQHQEQRDAVHPEAPGDPEGRDPLMGGDELVAAVARAEGNRRRGAEAEHRQGRHEPSRLHEAALSARDEGDDDGRPGGEEDEHAQVGEGARHDALVST